MNYLLDTNVIIWLATDRQRVPQSVRDFLRNEDSPVFVSAVSAWEYGQKRLLRPDELHDPFEDLLRAMPVERLDFAFDLHRYAETLPLIHRDPFDRMLIAQALHHGMTLVTPDDKIRRYAVPTLW